MSEQKPIKGYECKHIHYVSAKDDSKDDLLCIKQNIHYKDGTIEPTVRFVENYKRDFWITKPGFRTYNEKLEWEEESHLQKFSCTQRNLVRSVAKALGNPGFQGGMRTLARNPFVYGTDVSTPVLAKRAYMNRFPDCTSHNSVAVLDIETDVVLGHELPISIALTFKEKCFLTYTEEFIGGIQNPEEKIRKKFTQHLGEYEKLRNVNLEIVEAKTPGEMIVETLKRAHEWMPDFIAIWNINFDLPKILNALKLEGIEPEDVFCHPSLPPKYRHFRYIEGPANKLTASGKYMTLAPADRWHVVDCPASFYFIDAMCVYKKIRTAKGNLPSYSLDYVLNKEVDLSKLRFKEADNYSGIELHKFMQTQYKIEYLIYNVFDCMSMEILDEKTKDLAVTISVLCEHSEYSKFPSQPRRTCDDLHFFCQLHGLIIGSTSDEMVVDKDDLVISPKNIIITLATHLVDNNGLKVFEDLPDLRSYIRAHAVDLD